jgi:DNA repair protein RecO (recombination protein O)
MRVYSSDALVLRTYRYGEADCIVVFLTADRGKKRGVAKNATKSRRRFGAALEPLTRGCVTYMEREHRELVRVDRVEPVASPLHVQAPGLKAQGPITTEVRGSMTDGAPGLQPRGLDAHVLAHVAYFAELLNEWTPESQANERLFRLGVSVGEALGRGGSVEALARYFEYWLLRLEGVYPALEASTRLTPLALAFLESAMTCTPGEIVSVDVDAMTLREIEQMHQRLISMHLEKDVRSARVVRELRPHP